MTSAEKPDTLFSPAQAAKLLNVSLSWLAKARMRGDGPPFVKMGRVVRYSELALREYIQTRMRRSTSNEEVRNRSSLYELVGPILVAIFDRNGWVAPPTSQALMREVKRQLPRALSEKRLDQLLYRLWQDTQDPRYRR